MILSANPSPRQASSTSSEIERCPRSASAAAGCYSARPSVRRTTLRLVTQTEGFREDEVHSLQSESNDQGTASDCLPAAAPNAQASSASGQSSGQPSGTKEAQFEWTLEVRTKLRDQDPEALGLFYDAYFDRLYGYIRRMVGEDHLAEDVTQDVFLHLHRSLPSYDPERALRPWVFTIATNKVRDFWRSRRYRETLRETSYDEPEGDPYAESDERSPLAEIANSELGELMTEAIERLPDGMRTTFTLRYFEGMSFAAIGEVIQRNEAAVRKRYSRAMEELRIDLAKVLEITGEGEA